MIYGYKKGAAAPKRTRGPDPSILFQMLKVCTINRQSLLKIATQVLFQWKHLNITKVVYHLFHLDWEVILDYQAENFDDRTKLICCNRYREDTNLTYYLNCKISRLSVCAKSSCERCVYTVKRQIQCHILSKGGDVQFQRAIRTIYTLTAELVKTC